MLDRNVAPTSLILPLQYATKRRRSIFCKTDDSERITQRTRQNASAMKPALQNGLSLARDDWSSRIHHREVKTPDLLFPNFAHNYADKRTKLDGRSKNAFSVVSLRPSADAHADDQRFPLPLLLAKSTFAGSTDQRIQPKSRADGLP
jgi:hypothetical protein